MQDLVGVSCTDAEPGLVLVLAHTKAKLPAQCRWTPEGCNPGGITAGSRRGRPNILSLDMSLEHWSEGLVGSRSECGFARSLCLVRD